MAGKAIFTRKFICGNFVPPGTKDHDDKDPGQNKALLHAAGCEVAHVRQIAALGARVGWAGFLLGIKTAFLNSLLLDPINLRTAPPLP